MNAVMTTSRPTRLLAGTVAALATTLALGGPLGLAEHYAQSGASGDASGYYATVQNRRLNCADNGNSRAVVISPRSSAENS